MHQHISTVDRLKSIAADSLAIQHIIDLVHTDAVFPNRSAGAWYHQHTQSVYFKSTDGHTGQYAFSLSRINLHLAQTAAIKPVLVIDATRRGKRFPDSQSKTIPIWCAVINQAIVMINRDITWKIDDYEISLPYWVPFNEEELIRNRIPELVHDLMNNAPPGIMNAVQQLAKSIKNPLRAVWIDRNSNWSADIQDDIAKRFSLVICVSASTCEEHVRRFSRKGWNYIQGAADDEANWANIKTNTGLQIRITPELFWMIEPEIRAETILTDEQLYEALESIISKEEFKVESDSLKRICTHELKLHQDSVSYIDCFFSSFRAISQLRQGYECIIYCTESKMPSNTEFLADDKFFLVFNDNRKHERMANVLEIQIPLIFKKFESLSNLSRFAVVCDSRSIQLLICTVAALELFAEKTLSACQVSKSLIRKRVIDLVVQLSMDVSISRAKMQQLNRLFCSS